MTFSYLPQQKPVRWAGQSLCWLFFSLFVKERSALAMVPVIHVPLCCLTHISYSLSPTAWASGRFCNFHEQKWCSQWEYRCPVRPSASQRCLSFWTLGPHLRQPKLEPSGQETKAWLHRAQIEQEGAHKTYWKMSTDTFSDFEHDQWSQLRAAFLAHLLLHIEGSQLLGSQSHHTNSLRLFYNWAVFWFSAWTFIFARWLSVVLLTHSWGKCLWRWCFSF